MKKITLILYLLRLADGKYYVGQSDDPNFRFSEHLKGTGSKWTRRHRPLEILKTKLLEVESPGEAMLYENWMTLYYMEQFGWENVRGGDYLVIESYRLQRLLAHIYDTEFEKIRYYLPKCPYLFGRADDTLIYILALENDRFYVGSCKQLGKALGEHFNGTGIAWTRDNRAVSVLELIVVKDGGERYVDLKNRLLLDYISRYGWENVLGGQMPGKDSVKFVGQQM